MAKLPLNDKPIAHGYTAGGACVLVASLWVWVGYSVPAIILFLSIGVSIIFYSVFWHSTKVKNLIERFWDKLKTDTIFLSIILLIIALVIFIMLYFFTKGGLNQDFFDGIFVEMFGIVFDVAVLVLLFNWINEKGEKKRKISRYKEELNDYRGWTENEAAYRVAGIIRRLKKEGVNDINYSKLHLGKCSKEIIEEALKSGYTLASLEDANLRGSNLENCNLFGLNLKNAKFTEAILKNASFHSAVLKGANFHLANLENADFREADIRGIVLYDKHDILRPYNYEPKTINLENVKVDEIEWIHYILKSQKVKGYKKIKQEYFVSDKLVHHEKGGSSYIIKRR